MEKTDRERIRVLVRTLYDFQDMRIRMANRLKLKKDDSSQKKAEKVLDKDSIPVIREVKEDAQKMEQKLAKAIEAELKELDIWKHFLKDVKGVGPMITGVIISEYDIYIATTVSKMWQFTGLNPGMVKGIKIIAASKYNPSMGKIIGELQGRDGKKLVKVLTDEMVRGDKLTPGFVAPFNKWLRTKMCGVLGSSFLKCGSSYSEIYYNEKTRLENSEQTCGDTEKMWKDEKPGHRHNAAIRKMIKIFLQDLYQAWRTLEGLEVRKPYQEEYLRKKHIA